LFQPITIRLNNKRKKDCMSSVWRPSKVEQAAAFITFIPVSFIYESKLKNKWIKNMLTWNNILQDGGKLKTLHNSKIEKALQFGLTLQLYVVIVGSTEIFTVVNNIYFKLETLLKGLDLCFKTFFFIKCTLSCRKWAVMVFHTEIFLWYKS